MKLLIISIFAIAMAFLETAVVIYLRELMYPGGFAFPLAPILPDIALVELLRELATMIMLVTIGFISGRNFATRFAWFIYNFAIWDIFYYLFLKVMIGWPESLFTWDILFLIPVMWTGPVISPVIVSLSMILLASVILRFSIGVVEVKINPKEWTGLIIGSLLLILSFTWDYSVFLLGHFSFGEIFFLPDKTAIFETTTRYIPEKFNWILFGLGQGVVMIVILFLYLRLRASEKGVYK